MNEYPYTVLSSYRGKCPLSVTNNDFPEMLFDNFGHHLFATIAAKIHNSMEFCIAPRGHYKRYNLKTPNCYVIHKQHVVLCGPLRFW